jgi:anti-anti-sigma factor
MSTAIVNTMDTAISVPAQMSELIRGQNEQLIEQIAPLVRRRNVSLDLSQVERIDAAGIAALISLYGWSRDAGHCFTVSNASPRVAGILTLVGLDQVLLSHNTIEQSYSGPMIERPAA